MEMGNDAGTTLRGDCLFGDFLRSNTPYCANVQCFAWSNFWWRIPMYAAFFWMFVVFWPFRAESE